MIQAFISPGKNIYPYSHVVALFLSSDNDSRLKLHTITNKDYELTYSSPSIRDQEVEKFKQWLTSTPTLL
jgi:hypothetical protein